MMGVKNGGCPQTGARGVGGRFTWPVLLTTVLLCLGAVVAAGGMFPNLLSFPKPPPPIPSWQQVPDRLSGGADSVLPLDASAPIPVAGEVAKLLDATLKPDGAGSISGVVMDASTGQILFDREANANRIPASNMKLLTAAAALKALGPESRFTTRVLASDNPSTVVLTGGEETFYWALPLPSPQLFLAGPDSRLWLRTRLLLWRRPECRDQSQYKLTTRFSAARPLTPHGVWTMSPPAKPRHCSPWR